jgi:antirestriction protein ArdC
MNASPSSTATTSAPTTATHKAAQLLAENVRALLNSESYQTALRFKSRFYRYSFNNCLLISLQCPTATQVAGYRTWQQLGRQVKKGEKAIAILAPILKKVEVDGQEVEKLIGFRTAHVFDISQTEGEELPEVPRPQLLSGRSEAITRTLKSLEAFATHEGYSVERRVFSGSALGRFSPAGQRITLRDGLEPMQELKTLIHELAHALLHRDLDPRSEKRHLCELEAESCAFIVCHSLGLDTSRYSFPYLAHWADDPAELLPAAERACKAAERLLEALRGLQAQGVVAEPTTPRSAPMPCHDALTLRLK